MIKYSCTFSFIHNAPFSMYPIHITSDGGGGGGCCFIIENMLTKHSSLMCDKKGKIETFYTWNDRVPFIRSIEDFTKYILWSGDRTFWIIAHSDIYSVIGCKSNCDGVYSKIQRDFLCSNCVRFCSILWLITSSSV